jgi:hypothetical protein
MDSPSQSVTDSQKPTSSKNLNTGETCGSNAIEELASQSGKERKVSILAPKGKAPMPASLGSIAPDKDRSILGVGSSEDGSTNEPDTNETLDLRDALDKPEKMGKDDPELLSRIAMLQGELQDLQDIAINNFVSSSWTPLEDQVIDAILTEIHEDLDDWCDDYCAKDFRYFLSLSPKQAIEAINPTRATAFAAYRPTNQIRWWSEQWWTENSDGGHDLSRILKAILAREMCFTLIKNPFMIVDALQTKGEQDRLRHQVLEDMADVEIETAHVHQASLGICRVFKTLENGM